MCLLYSNEHGCYCLLHLFDLCFVQFGIIIAYRYVPVNVTSIPMVRTYYYYPAATYYSPTLLQRFSNYLYGLADSAIDAIF